MKKERILLAGSLLLHFNLMAQNYSPAHFVENMAEPGRFLSPRERTLVKMEAVDSSRLRDCCRQLTKDRRRIYLLFDNHYKMSMRLKGVYVKQDLMFFRLGLVNRSNIDYLADTVRFFILHDGRSSDPRLPQTKDIKPLYVYDGTSTYPGKTSQETVFVLPRVTLPKNGRLVIQLTEANGSRHLHLVADNGVLLKARLI